MAILGLVAVEAFIFTVGATFGAVSYALEHRALRRRINAYGGAEAVYVPVRKGW